MKWQRWSWLFFLAFAVVISIIFTALSDGPSCRFQPNAKGCSDAHLNAGLGGLIVVVAVVFLAGWAWLKWRLRKRDPD